MPDHDPSLTAETGTTRRTVLRAAGLAALGGGGVSMLAACASDAEVGAPAASTAAPTPAASSASPSASASASASGSASASSSASAAPSGPSIATADVPVGGGVVLEDAKYVVTQPAKGEFKAFSSTCTHQGCKVSDVTDTINCKCHGSKFSIEDGSVTSPPADQPLAEAKATVSGDSVFVEA